MARFIRVTVDGYEALVNINAIGCVYEDEGGRASIVAPDGGYIRPAESYKEIRMQVAAATGGFPVRQEIPEGMD